MIEGLSVNLGDPASGGEYGCLESWRRYHCASAHGRKCEPRSFLQPGRNHGQFQHPQNVLARHRSSNCRRVQTVQITEAWKWKYIFFIFRSYNFLCNGGGKSKYVLRFFSRRILVENVPTITVGSFFRHERSTFLFICSTTSNLNNFKPQQLQPQKRVQNEKKTRPQRKHTKDPTLAPLFFGTMRLFVFCIAPEGPPFICFDILQHNGCQKIAKGPPFTFVGTVTLQKSH